MKDHIVSHKTTTDLLNGHHRALQRQECLKINFREIFGAVRFSTFATLSVIFGLRRDPERLPLYPHERTSLSANAKSEKCQKATSPIGRYGAKPTFWLDDEIG
jgi:hypothetical protein